MDFQEINTNLGWWAAGLFLLSVVTIIFILLAIGTISTNLGKNTKEEEKSGKIETSIIIAVTLILVGLCFMGFNASLNIKDGNKQTLVSNIEEKYDVDKVELNEYGAYNSPTKTDKQKIYVVVDGTTYMFYLTQDRNTWEPTLEDPPVPGGSNTNPSITADDLLKQ